MQIPITGPAYVNESQDANYQRCVNMYCTDLGDFGRGTTEGRSVKYGPLLPTGGVAELTDLSGRATRGIWKIGNNNFTIAVRDRNIYKLVVNDLTKTCTTLLIGTMSETDEQAVIRLAYNPFQCLIVNGSTNGYLYNYNTTGRVIPGPIGGSGGDTYSLTINGTAIYTNQPVSTALTLSALVTQINLFTSTTGITASQIVIGSGTYVQLKGAADSTITVVESGTGFVSGTDGLTKTGGDFASPIGALIVLDSGSDFLGAVDVAYLDGYFIIARPDSQIIQSSGINDGRTWNPINYTQVGTSPDNIIGLAVQKEELWVFGSQRTSIYYNAANSPGFPLSARDGISMAIGCMSLASIIEFNNGIMLLNSSGNIVQTQTGDYLVNTTSGYQLQPVSTIPINKDIADYSRIDDCKACWYEYRGHMMAQYTFPSANKTWVFDSTIGAWHERSSFNALLSINGDHLCCYSTQSGTLVLMSGYKNGKIYYQSDKVYDDNGVSIPRIRTIGPINKEFVPLTIDELIIRMETGNIPQGLDPQIILKYSNDGAHTWSYDLPAPVGKVGEYAKLINWNLRTLAREWFFEWSMYDPIPFSIIDCSARITLGE